MELLRDEGTHGPMRWIETHSAEGPRRPRCTLSIAALLVAWGTLVSCGSGRAAPGSESEAKAAAPGGAVGRPVEWAYAGVRGPARWSTLSPSYSACAHAGTQSPIDLVTRDVGSSAGSAAREASDEARLRFDYQPSSLRVAHHRHVSDIVDDGHTIQVTLDEGSYITTPTGIHTLRQFHFHAPAEHRIDGRSFPLEIHFVHRSASGHFAVVAALVEVGRGNPNLGRLIEHLPARHGDQVHRPHVTIDPAGHLADTGAVFAYHGSLTTPPCSEEVEWFVLRRPLSAGADQIEAIAQKIAPNARPLQDGGRRVIALEPMAFGDGK